MYFSLPVYRCLKILVSGIRLLPTLSLKIYHFQHLHTFLTLCNLPEPELFHEVIILFISIYILHVLHFKFIFQWIPSQTTTSNTTWKSVFSEINEMIFIHLLAFVVSL